MRELGEGGRDGMGGGGEMKGEEAGGGEHGMREGVNREGTTGRGK